MKFFLSEQGGGTLLRVVESGFESLVVPAEPGAATVEGWEMQLGFAKREAEPPERDR